MKPCKPRTNKVRNQHADLPSSNWDLIKSPAADQIVPYDKLPTQFNHQHLDKLAVLKVNGGLGTSMGVFQSRRG